MLASPFHSQKKDDESAAQLEPGIFNTCNPVESEIFQNRPRAVPPASPPPWQTIQSGEMPPLMLQFRFQSGETISYAYHDLREIRVRDAGMLQLGIVGLSRLRVTIEGRHLRELVDLIGSGLVRSVQETDERADDLPEQSPCITSIAIETIDGA
ncbi:MAG: hypothetical protein ACK5Q5_14405 [Planctomycetaceae bacterium]